MGQITLPVALNAANFAAPSASIGLVAQAGVANTAMRSDAAPALDITISPTWTGTHAFLGNINSTYQAGITNQSNGNANRARLVVDSGDTQTRITATGSGSTAAVMGGGPVGASLNIVMVQDAPIVLGNNSNAMVIIQPGGGNLDLIRDNQAIRIGAGADFTILHNGADSTVNNITGALNINNQSSNLNLQTGGTTVLQCDASAVADNTRSLIYDVTAAVLKRISRGIADSGGVGFRLLRIPN